MRQIAKWLLVVCAFSIPWEYSFDLGAPLGNIARISELLLLVVGIPAMLQLGCMRRPDAVQGLTLIFFLWLCCTFLWSIEPEMTWIRLRAFLQETMIVWLVWEFCETPEDLRMLLRAFVAGSWILAALTIASFHSAEAAAEGQIRFVSEGQDPNDVARFLDVAFPMAALLADCETTRWKKLLGIGYLPWGFLAVALTASRGGFVGAVLALIGCAILLRARRTALLATMLALPALAAVLWLAVPHESLARIATIPAQLHGGDLNQRINIWHAGWQAFQRAPMFGSGSGAFSAASGLNSNDTAHDTALSIAVESGLVGLAMCLALAATAFACVLSARGSVRIAMLFSMLVWGIASITSTVEENRATWLLAGMAAVIGRFSKEENLSLSECFSSTSSVPAPFISTHAAVTAD